MHFRHRTFQNPDRARKSKRIVMAVALLTMTPSVLLTVGIVNRSIFDNQVSRFVKMELSQSGTQVISSSIDGESMTLNVVAVGREITDSTQRVASKNRVHYNLAQYSLNIIQGENSDTAIVLNNRLTQITSSREEDRKKMVEMSAKMTELSAKLEGYARYERLTQDVTREMKSLFPGVSHLTIAKVVQTDRDSLDTRHFVAAIITQDGKAALTQAERDRLHDWLQSRVGADSLVLY